MCSYYSHKPNTSIYQPFIIDKVPTEGLYKHFTTRKKLTLEREQWCNSYGTFIFQNIVAYFSCKNLGEFPFELI